MSNLSGGLCIDGLLQIAVENGSLVLTESRKTYMMVKNKKGEVYGI